MRRRRLEEEEDEQVRRPPDRSWSSRLAWLTLFGGAALLVTRVSFATVVEVHGDGMAPTLLHGEHILLMRGDWSLEHGDVVVYDPSLAFRGSNPAPHLDEEEPDAAQNGERFPDARKDPARDFRNTAVVDPEELEENWQKVQRRSDGIVRRKQVPLRLGRVLAVPGDMVTVHDERGALGLAVNGEPLLAKHAEPLRISLRGETVPPAEPPPPRMRAMAYESTGERRYPVLVPIDDDTVQWEGLAVPPPAEGPVQIEAEGYLVIADNRDEGACCDSRALGWIPADAIHGEVIMRLPGDPTATPDLDPDTRGLLWNP